MFYILGIIFLEMKEQVRMFSMCLNYPLHFVGVKRVQGFVLCLKAGPFIEDSFLPIK
jgi:hypothetical protein